MFSGFRKGRGTRDRIANIIALSQKQEFQKNFFSFIDYAKTFDCVDHNKLWKILPEMRIPDHLTCLLRNLYAGQEETELDMEQQTGSKMGIGVCECEVKWALESITMNKASGGDGIPVELFQILKDDVVKVPHSICQQIWKTQQWPQD